MKTLQIIAGILALTSVAAADGPDIDEPTQ
jgi:hypothetical protein